MSVSRRDFLAALGAAPMLAGFTGSKWFQEPQKMLPDEIRTTELGGSFASDYAVIRPALRGSGVALLATGLDITYRQSIQVWDPKGDEESRYYIGGRTQGVAKFARVIGPTADFEPFIKYHSQLEQKLPSIRLNVHNEDDPKKPNEEIGTRPDQRYQLRHAVISFIGVRIQVGNMMICEDMQMMFTDLLLPDGKRYDFPLAGMERGET